jgi:DNA-binding Xre family transcriptional regulator
MTVSYNGLWKMLIDRGKKRTDLVNEIDISSGTLAKMGKGECVNLSVLCKICEKYGCDFGDIVSYVGDDK